MRDKSELRDYLTTQRALAFEALPEAGVHLAAHFPASIDVSNGVIVAGYMPFRTEIDVLPLLRTLILCGARCAMPRMNSPSTPRGGRGEALTFHLCDLDDPPYFTLNKWGLLEPEPSLPKVTPNILLVPLLGFDRHGNRIGYGKGFYDTAIAQLRATTQVTTIGVAFSAQEVAEIPTQPHDQRLDWILTENEAYRCPS
jgi:5-formyltetrahydrofolate cyclo-ligase